MSKLSRAAATSQTLSLVAMEEASRLGLREADLEHLLLALVVSEQPAGVALRSVGITLTDARAAVESLHREQLASLGITTGLPDAGRIVFHETRGYEWTRRASDLIGRAAGRGRAGDAAAVLRELLAEPSGQVCDLLDRLGTTPQQVLAELAQAEASRAETTPRPRTTRPRVPGVTTRTTQTFVPAPVDDVWALVSTPERIPEWYPPIGSVETPRPAETTTWAARSTTTDPSGAPVRVRADYVRCQVELVDTAPPARVRWRFTFPDAAARRPVVVEVALAPTTGGTQVSVTQAWTRATGWRAVVIAPLRPLQRVLLWLATSQTGNAISRAFRQPEGPQQSPRQTPPPA
jgi:uncharacterized protein YndB with AHSA1/START domain